MDNLLFVYGTLKRGGRLNHHLIAQGCEYVGEGTAYGELYDAGPFPVLVKVDDSRERVVHGELWRMERPTHTLVVLDAVENGLYERQRTPVIYKVKDSPKFMCQPAWVYFAVGAWWHGAKLLDSGRWPERIQ